MVSQGVGEPQGAGARLPGVYFQSSFAVACYYFCAHAGGVAWRYFCAHAGGVACGVAWRGVAWRGVAWRGVAWRGVAWRGVAWRGVAWRGVAWRGVAWRGGLWREEVVALRGGLWRRRRRFWPSGRRWRSVARRISCVAGRSVAAGAWRWAVGGEKN
jgi:hypothetical protein